MDKEPMDQNQRALDRFLNDLTTSQASAGGHDVDPALVKAMRELRSLAQTPPPDPMRERVTSEVEIAIERLTGEGGAITQPMNGATPRATLQAVPHFPRMASGPANTTSETIIFPWRLALVAAALLVLLGAGYVLFGSGLFDDDRPKTVPAAVAPTAPPTPDVRSEGTVVEVTIPAEVLPAGVAGSALAHFTLPPGTASTWTVSQNAMLHAVLDGTLVVRSDSPMQVLRAPGDGAWETVPGGAEVSLGPGDLALLLTMTTADFDNPGDVPVEMVQWILSADTSSDPPMPTTWVVNNYALSGGGGVSLTGGPAVLRLERKVLAPGDTILFAPEGVLQFVIGMPDNGAGTPVPAWLPSQISGKAINYVADTILVYVATLTFVVPDASPAAGTPPP